MEEEDEDSSEHPFDKHYKSLHCELTPLDHEHEDFKVCLVEYVLGVHTIRHRAFTLTVKVMFTWNCHKLAC